MRRWIPRTLYAMVLGVTLPASVCAQQPTPAPMPAGGAPGQYVVGNPYQVATPYSPTVVNQSVPNPQLNRTDYTLPCYYPNQNLAPYAPSRPEGQQLFNRNSGCSSCGDSSSGLFGWLKSKGGCCTKPGSCATCCNTANFFLGSSRSFFGESSREFFERPAAVDGIKHAPKKYAPPAGAVAVGGFGFIDQ